MTELGNWCGTYADKDPRTAELENIVRMFERDDVPGRRGKWDSVQVTIRRATINRIKNLLTTITKEKTL